MQMHSVVTGNPPHPPIKYIFGTQIYNNTKFITHMTKGQLATP